MEGSKTKCEVEGQKSPPSPPKTQWLLLIILSAMCFIEAMIFSLPYPFYPAEAESKDVSPSEYGMVLGIFGFTQFIFGPIYGSYMDKFGVRNALHAGIITAGVSTIMFGFLTYLEDRILFLILSSILRFAGAAGSLAFTIALLTLAATEFPGAVARTLAILETVWGLGFSFGPSVGMALFNIGGFVLPFLGLGITICLSDILAYKIFPKPKTSADAVISKSESECDGEKKSSGFIALIKVPSVALYLFCVAVTIFAYGFITALLEPDLRQFMLSSTMLSLMFLIQGMTQATTSMLFGYICDKISRREFVTIFGAIILTLSAFLIGPFSYLPIEPSIALTALSLVLLGIGVNAIFVSSFVQGLEEATENGFPMCEATSSLVSGSIMSSNSLGLFIGPLFGGILYEHFGGFRNATSVLTMICLAMTLALVLFALRKTKKPKNELTKL